MKLLNTKEAADRLGLCTRTLRRLDLRAAGPRSVMAGNRRLYLESDLQGWLAAGGDR